MQVSLFNEKWEDEKIVWFSQEDERNEELEKLKIIIGVDKFGNLLNRQVPTAHYEDGKGFVKFGITKI